MYLSEVLNDMDFRLEKENGQYKIYDLQTHEYLNTEDFDGNLCELYKDRYEIIDRMETFIDDYWFREVRDELSELGELDDESWESMLIKTKKLKNRFQHPEYITYIPVLKCLVDPAMFEGVYKD